MGREDALKLAKKEASRERGQTGAKEKLRIRLDAAVDGLRPSVIEFADAVVTLSKHAATYSRVASHAKKERGASWSCGKSTTSSRSPS